MKGFAKIVRGITVPPVMVSVLFVLLYFYKDDVVPTLLDLMLSLFFLAVVPALAYPLQAVVPAFARADKK